jgi:hypothetical protein
LLGLGELCFELCYLVFVRSGPEIDYHLVLGRCLYRKVGGLFAFEDAIDVAGRGLVWLDCFRSIANQPPAAPNKRSGVDPRQLLLIA